MFIADRLVYLQLQKTGCTHIAHILADCIGGKQIGKHNCEPDIINNKYIIGSIRNPWDWYVSLWAFGCGRKGNVYRRLTGVHNNLRWFTRKVFRNLWQTKRVPVGLFKEAVASSRRPTSMWLGVYTNSSDAESFRAWLRLMFDPKRSTDLGEGYGNSSLNRFSGFFTYRYLRLYSRNLSAVLSPNHFSSVADLLDFDSANNLLNAVIKNEMLEDDLIQAISAAGYNLSEEQRRMIHSGKYAKRNASKHMPTNYYYDRETIELVGEREQFLIKKYGYQPPSLC